MQRKIFKIGCYLTFFTAALHVYAIVSGGLQPENDAERQLFDLMRSYRFHLPGADRTMMDFQDGFSMVFSLMVALSAGLATIIVRRSVNDPLLITSAARAMAGAYIVMLVISLTHFFLIPTICLGSVALAFTIASFSKP